MRESFESHERKPRLRERQALRLELKPPLQADRRRLEALGPHLRDQRNEIESVIER